MQALRPYRMALLFVMLLAAAAPAQSLRESTSLRFVPASASLYSASLRNREQLERFVNSRAFAKLKSLPLVQMGLAQAKARWESDEKLAHLREFLAQPENQQLVDLLLDGMSREIFVYGDARHGKWLGTLAQMSNRMNLAQMQAAQRGISPDEAIGRAVVELLEKDPDLLRVPGTVIGFRLSDTQPAITQIARLETLLKQVIEAKRPDLKDRVTRQAIGDASFLTLKLDGTLVPWNNILEKADLDDDARDQLAIKLQKATLNISLGVYQDYLLLSFGEDDSQLRSIGQGSLLVDHPKMAKLAKYFDRPVTSVGYASDEFVQQVTAVNQQFDQFLEMFRTGLRMVPLSEDIKQDLLKDAASFVAEAKALQVKPGAMAAVTYEADGAFETVAYDWSENRSLDDSQTLTIVDHVGGDPIAFYASRRKADPQAEAFGRKWTVKLGQYFDRIAVPFMDRDQQELYQEVRKRMLPLLVRLADANRQKFAPALADGQSAIVLDAQLSKPQWHLAMPAADEAVPLPEITCVWGVSDAKLLREGAREYFDVLQDAITAMSEIMPDQIPPIQLPPPQTETTAAGTIYSYPIPPFVGLDADVAPNAGLSDTAMAMSLVPQATKRVLENQPPAATGPLAQVSDRSLATAWQFKTDRFIQMVRPWVKYGFQVAEQQRDIDPMIPMHVSAVLDVLECIRTSNGVSYFEGNARVKFSRCEFQDLAP